MWLGSLVPLATDVVNGRFTFETLTAPTGNRLHFPAYDKYIKEIDKYVRHLTIHCIFLMTHPYSICTQIVAVNL